MSKVAALHAVAQWEIETLNSLVSSVEPLARLRPPGKLAEEVARILSGSVDDVTGELRSSMFDAFYSLMLGLQLSGTATSIKTWCSAVMDAKLQDVTISQSLGRDYKKHEAMLLVHAAVECVDMDECTPLYVP